MLRSLVIETGSLSWSPVALVLLLAALPALAAGLPGNEPVAFYTYADPQRHDGRSPDIGVNWLSETGGPIGPPGFLGTDNGGHVMFGSGLDTLRIGFNDCTAPATYLPVDEWHNVSPVSHLLSLDNALFTDPVSGRTVAAQATGASAALAWTDDDGNNWTPGVGAAPGADLLHLGGGRLAEPLYSALTDNNPGYNDFAHGVYACFQQINGASCGVSVDGANSFAPPVPVWTLLECGTRPGRIQVSPASGAAALPSRSCGGEQGYALSLDNGLNWNLRTVPLSGVGEWDPSVSFGADGTVYFGFDRGGLPMISVSTDNGLNWSVPVDVSFGAIKTTAYPAVVAGDGDRAAFAFLGTDSVGALANTPGIPAVWHLYVAMTFDRGVTWNTTNVTGTDPVQRGAICTDGLACTIGGNLGSYIDIRMDRRGRPVVAYADGCVDQCVTNPAANSFSAVASIARLKSWKGLLAAHDAERAGQPDLPLTTATTVGPDVELEWWEPGDGGNVLTGYRIIKDQMQLATLGPQFRRYTDVGGAFSPGSYRVLAQNAAGDSRIKPGCDEIVVIDPCPEFCPPPPGPCELAGVTVLTDNAGDSDAGLGTGLGPGAYDLLRLGISESFDDFGADRIAFVLEVQSTETLPPNSIWPVQFKDASGADRFVRMDTTTNTPVFSYGAGLDINPLTNPGTAAESGSNIVGDYIVIVVSRAAVGADINESITDFLVRVRINGGAATLTPDNMPNSLSGDGSYPLYGSENCDFGCGLLPTDDFATTDACSTVDIDVLANDFDPEEPIALIGVGSPGDGTAVIIEDITGYKIRYRPDIHFSGTDSFSYTVSNGTGCTAEADVIVMVETTPDTDNDGILDSCDNCLNVSNPDQCNTNASQDSFGNLCDADFDNNGFVNFNDLGLIRGMFFANSTDPEYNPDMDMDCNDTINFDDIGLVRGQFFGPPGPSGLTQ